MNFLAIALFMADNYWKLTGWPVEVQGMVVAVGNMVLRMFTTQPVTARRGK